MLLHGEDGTFCLLRQGVNKELRHSFPRLAKGQAEEYGQAKTTEDAPMPSLTMENAEEIKRRIGELNLEHRDLDRAIDALEHSPFHDELQLKRLKKRKLMLKDQIFMLQRQLVPDIPA